jgi:hypothetical protein
MNQANSSEDCSAVRFDSPGYLMQNTPVLDQGNTGTCYAHAASTALSAKLQSVGIVSNPNPIALSMTSGMFTGGNNCDAFNSAVNEGWCETFQLDQRSLESLLAYYNRYANLKKTVAEVYAPIEENFIKRIWISGSTGASANLNEKGRVTDLLLKEKRKATTGVQTVLNGISHCGASNQNVLDLHAIGKALGANDEIEFIKNIMENCQRKQWPPGKKKPTCNDIDKKNSMATMRDHFNGAGPKTSPLLISYRTSIVFSGKDLLATRPVLSMLAKAAPEQLFLPKGVESIEKSRFDDIRNSGHASVVIGRRKNASGVCQYLLQNSWGTDCSSYPEHLECENGKYWVDSDLIEKAMINIGVIND